MVTLICYKKLKDMREDNDYKQSEIANYIKCDKDRYVKWENGVNAIPLEYVIKLSNFYNVSVSYLLNMTKEKGVPTIEIFDMNKVASNMRNLRKQNNELQKDISYLLKCSADTISCYENAKNNITTEKAILICEHYNITIEELLS